MGRETILVADDDVLVRNMVRKILVHSGYRVITAANGAEALGIMDSHDGGIDLVLTDVIMPEMDGVELARKIMFTHPEMKVLFRSGYTSDIRMDVVGEGKGHFIEKPFDLPTLVRKVRDTLDDGAAGA